MYWLDFGGVWGGSGRVSLLCSCLLYFYYFWFQLSYHKAFQGSACLWKAEHIKYSPQGSLCPCTTQTIISLLNSLLRKKVQKEFFLWSQQHHNLVSSTVDIVYRLISGGFLCVSRSVCNSWSMKHNTAEVVQYGDSLDQMSNSRGRALPHEREHGRRMSCCCPENCVWGFFYLFKNCVHQDKRLPLKIMATIKPFLL